MAKKRYDLLLEEATMQKLDALRKKYGDISRAGLIRWIIEERIKSMDFGREHE
ncbi:hypothetical protein H6504_00435 [Candidatus Woesearchaeota archaeon]|nr:hypothetical protein [Candidatus Woesearchaeota archaeon]